MIDVTGTYERLSFRPDGDMEITFRIPASQKGGLMQGIDELISKGVKDLSIKAGKKKRKRSLDANDYLWVLCTKIAEKVPLVTKEDVYRKHIRSVGVYTPLAVQEKAVDTFVETWGKNGTGWVVEVVDSTLDGCKKVFAYHGSSTYNTEEMKRLIDSVIQDCIALGIETMPPAELESLLTQWGKKNGKSEP
ncbi:hypothetical protein [Anaerotignum sp.]